MRNRHPFVDVGIVGQTVGLVAEHESDPTHEVDLGVSRAVVRRRADAHETGAGDIVGFIDNLRIEGAKLLGDLHLLENSPHRGYILEIAQKIPDTFGLSIAFSGPAEMSADKKTVLQRCSEIYSVDIVSEPAANPSGFFSRKLKQLQVATETETETETESPEIEIELPMNEETKKAIAGMIESAMMGLSERLSKLEAGMPKPEDKPEIGRAHV